MSQSTCNPKCGRMSEAGSNSGGATTLDKIKNLCTTYCEITFGPSSILVRVRKFSNVVAEIMKESRFGFGGAFCVSLAESACPTMLSHRLVRTGRSHRLMEPVGTGAPACTHYGSYGGSVIAGGSPSGYALS